MERQEADKILDWFVKNGLQHKRQLEVSIDIHRIEGFLNSLVSEDKCAKCWHKYRPMILVQKEGE